MRSVSIALTVVALALLLLAQHTSQQQFAWRPQGRFGKRTQTGSGQDVPEDIRTALSDEQSLSDLDDFSFRNQHVTPLDLPSFNAEGVVCINAGTSGGYYRCYRVRQAVSGGSGH